jgi:hypothetical protein
MYPAWLYPLPIPHCRYIQLEEQSTNVNPRNDRHSIPVEHGISSWIISSFLMAAESYITIANINLGDFMQTSPNMYDAYNSPLALRVYQKQIPVRSMCCLKLYCRHCGILYRVKFGLKPVTTFACFSLLYSASRSSRCSLHSPPNIQNSHNRSMLGLGIISSQG